MGKMNDLINLLSDASIAYYKNDNPIMTDKQYDDLCDELELLEKSTGIVMNNSPTQKVQGFILEGLKKVKHTKPMLSANKTKDINEIKKFIGNKKCVLSWKEDGLTIVLRYKNGKFVQAITRGTEGVIGEDVTHTMMMCKNIPMKIPYYADIEVRGECVLSWDEFNRINSTLDEPFKHPRNVAAGTVRQLDSNIAKERNISYKAFELVQDDYYNSSDSMLREQIMNVKESFDYLTECGFDVVEHEIVTLENFEEIMKIFTPEKYEYPVDGLIFIYDDYFYGKSLGVTSHHPLNMIAMKWEDELYETTLINIEWNTSKTGLINPVAIFEPVDLDGAITTRATLHNVSYVEDLKLGIGDSIMVYRSNMVIPKVHENLTKSNTWKIPNKCPNCNGNVETRNENGSKTLHCCNDGCSAKLLGRLNHFCSKNAINIEDMSETTLEFLINKGWVTCFEDLYTLNIHTNEWISSSGFGKKSVYKLLDNIQKSKNTTLDKFIYSLSVPLIGRKASKTISKYFNGNFNDFYDKWINNYNWTLLDDFGSTMNDSMNNFIRHNCLWIKELAKNFTFETPKENEQNNVSFDLSGKTFVITGTVNHFTNREELKETIENLGGKVSGSVSSKTDYLINNDNTSNSSKNKKAKELNIPIITETDFLLIIEK